MSPSRINRLEMQLPAPDYNAATAVQAEGKSWVTNEFSEAIDGLLEKKFQTRNDEWMIIDKLELIFPALPWKMEKADWQAVVEQGLQKAVLHPGAHQLVFKQWLNYLKSGVVRKNDIITDVKFYGPFIRKRLDALLAGLDDNGAFDFSAAFIARLLDITEKESVVRFIARILKLEMPMVGRFVENISAGDGNRFRQLQGWLPSPLNAAAMKKFILEFPGKAMAVKRDDHEPSAVPGEEKAAMELNSGDLQNGICCENAGVILVWPYLGSFFENINLMQNGGFINEDAAKLGARVIHYIATGQLPENDAELTIGKILCGLPPGEYAFSNDDPGNGIKNETTELLQSVVANWPALKNTSPDGLRSAFLTRRGFATVDAETVRIVVEESSTDMLLHQLPWGISMIKLSWTPYTIYTHWF